MCSASFLDLAMRCFDVFVAPVRFKAARFFLFVVSPNGIRTGLVIGLFFVGLEAGLEPGSLLVLGCRNFFERFFFFFFVIFIFIVGFNFGFGFYRRGVNLGCLGFNIKVVISLSLGPIQ
jgi:hypothetical protein